MQLAYYSAGVPYADYRLPPGPWVSDDDDWIIWSGTIRGYCYTIKARTLIGITVYVGTMQWFSYRGDNGPSSFGDNGNDWSSGWAYSNSSGSTRSGSGEHGSWQNALDSYILSGGTHCTEGWVIVIDGEVVCDGS